MEYARSLIFGSSSSSSSETAARDKSNAVLDRHRKEAAQHSFEERSAQLNQAQQMKIRQLEIKVQKANTAIKEAVDRGDRGVAASKMAERNRYEQELKVLRAKNANIESTRTAVSTANSNLAQGLLVQDGATELAGATQAMEQIDLQDAVDRLQDAGAQLNEHNDLLTEPIFGGIGLEGDEFEVDEEIEAMMREKQARDAATVNLPDLPSSQPRTGESNPLTRSSAGILPQKATEEIGEIKN